MPQAFHTCKSRANATQLVVDGKPFLITSGELSNNAASSLEQLEPVWPKIVASNLNTALVAISWAQFEPEEGKFDYTALDGVIAKARENHLRLVVLWFGSGRTAHRVTAELGQEGLCPLPAYSDQRRQNRSIVGPLEP